MRTFRESFELMKQVSEVCNGNVELEDLTYNFLVLSRCERSVTDCYEEAKAITMYRQEVPLVVERAITANGRRRYSYCLGIIADR